MSDGSLGSINSDQFPPFAVFKPLGEYMPDSDDMASITYTVKELLSDIRGSLGRLEGKLDAKADRSEVAELIRRVDSESNRITAIETHIATKSDVDEKNNEKHRRWHEFVWPMLASAALIVLGLIAWLHPVK